MGVVRRGLLASAIAGLLASSVVSLAAPVNTEPPPPTAGKAPPAARTVDVVDHQFGLTLPDPYRWMEGQKNAEFDAWLKAQGEYTRGQLDALPTLAAWRERLQQSTGAAVFNGGFTRAGGKLFFLRVSGKGTGTLMVQDNGGTQRVLLDPANLASAKSQPAIQGFSPSPDGRPVAVNVGVGTGSEVSRIKVIDVGTREWLPDTVEPVWGEFTARWLPDASGFAYTQMAPEGERTGGDPMQGMRARLHVLGTAAVGDPVLLRAGDGEGTNASFRLASNEFPVILFPTPDWATAVAGSARSEGRLCEAPRRQAVKPGTPWRCIAGYDDGMQDGAVHGDALYMLSVRQHPNGRVLKLDLSRPGTTLRDARVVVPMADDAVITGLAVARDAL